MLTTLNICKTGLGLGVLVMPSIFSISGWVLSLVSIIVIGLACLYSWNLLGKSLSKITKIYEDKGTKLKNLTLDCAMGLIFSDSF